MERSSTVSEGSMYDSTPAADTGTVAPSTPREQAPASNAPSSAPGIGIGSGAGSAAQVTGSGAQPQQQTPQSGDQKQSGSGVEPVTPSQPQTPPNTDEAINKLAETMISRMASVQQKQAPKAEGRAAMTAEQIEALRPVRVNAQMLQAIGFEEPTPEQIKGFQAMLDATVVHAAHVAAYVNEQRIQEQVSQFTPIVSRYQQQMQQEQTADFFKSNADLEKYPRFVAAAASRVSPTKPDGSPKSYKEAADEVAALTRSMLSEVGISSSQANANPSAAPVQTGVPSMPSLSGSGRSTSGSSGTGKSNNPDADIYS